MINCLNIINYFPLNYNVIILCTNWYKSIYSITFLYYFLFSSLHKMSKYFPSFVMKNENKLFLYYYYVSSYMLLFLNIVCDFVNVKFFNYIEEMLSYECNCVFGSITKWRLIAMLLLFMRFYKISDRWFLPIQDKSYG